MTVPGPGDPRTRIWMTRINRKDIMEQVRDDDGRVIGGYWYAPKADVFVCESVHQQVSHIAHSEADAEQWLRDNDAITPQQGGRGPW